MIRQQLRIAIATMMSHAHGMGSESMLQLQDMNREFMGRASGKGKGGGISARATFSKTTNNRKPHQGAKECTRRIAQGLA
jgi:hypothetical protein